MDFEKFLTKQVKHFAKELIKEGTGIKKPRKDFPKLVKQQVRVWQNNRCNNCQRVLDVANFDHINGDRSNNSLFNCQALCPNCHAKKTRRKV